MSLLEFVRDKTRDNFYRKLSDIGLECELAERGIVEEKLFNPWHRTSLGIIKINSDFPIKYINIIKKWGGKNDPPRWWHYFAVPTQASMSKEDQIDINSIRLKSFPIFGKVKSIDWKFNSNGENLAEKFTKDSEINALTTELGDIRVQSLQENFSGYSIELEFKRSAFNLFSAANISMNIRQWNTLNKIAKLCIENGKEA
tara:strand:- start:9263 stop:9862 length:600 start_codon:yes stop_codon:yes gene_type:complete